MLTYRMWPCLKRWATFLLCFIFFFIIQKCSIFITCLLCPYWDNHMPLSFILLLWIVNNQKRLFPRGKGKLKQLKTICHSILLGGMKSYHSFTKQLWGHLHPSIHPFVYPFIHSSFLLPMSALVRVREAVSLTQFAVKEEEEVYLR